MSFNHALLAGIDCIYASANAVSLLLQIHTLLQS